MREVDRQPSEAGGEETYVGFVPALGCEPPFVLGVAEAIIEHVNLRVGAQLLKQLHVQVGADAVLRVCGIEARGAGEKDTVVHVAQPERDRLGRSKDDDCAEQSTIQCDLDDAAIVLSIGESGSKASLVALRGDMLEIANDLLRVAGRTEDLKRELPGNARSKSSPYRLML